MGLRERVEGRKGAEMRDKSEKGGCQDAMGSRKGSFLAL